MTRRGPSKPDASADDQSADDPVEVAGGDDRPALAPEDAAEDQLVAARDALRRARITARDKGFRPGAPGRRKRTAADLGTGRRRDDGRDPGVLGDQLDKLLVERGWQVDVAAGSVMGRWAEIVGADVAAHATPVTFNDNVLTVRAESTAWATQLRLLSSTLMARMEEAVGPDVVQEIRVVGPNSPSWSRGVRKAPGGRGPRDTYG
ncbi:DUF721 domain-containing protein [Rudaeicoccus suwonensis]|uniref:Putative nucleic acid-binding Zn ribbon protein n=1 Tax=Rudaeicoccus suwonensis TaxID=657409 RepID=A0A561E409_9MICO|nr:DciA family protein [Rudaeicoccus suwonensis]TWE10354.1 putative nucleic acid-binding Zn ribbon protein [Rudaeicoccus suwonensis]